MVVENSQSFDAFILNYSHASLRDCMDIFKELLLYILDVLF
jgi:hypothetical protein